jgi:hypothetical protein
MKAAWMLGMAVLVTGLAGRGEAACSLGQITVPGLSSLYDPFDATFQPLSRIATLHTAGDCNGASVQLSLAPTPYSPQVGQKVLLRGNGTTLVATVTINNHATPVTPRGGSFAANPLLLQAGSSGEISLNLDLDPGQIAPPGYYDAQLLLQASAVVNGKAQQLENTLNIGVNVKPSVRLATGSGNLSIDLGELKAGTIGGPVSFNAYSNVDYVLSMHSDHGFLLTSQQHGDRGIPYEAMLQDAVDVVTTKGAQPLIKARFAVPATGLRHHWLRVKVNPFSNLGAGQYSDVLTVEISARV